MILFKRFKCCFLQRLVSRSVNWMFGKEKTISMLQLKASDNKDSLQLFIKVLLGILKYKPADFGERLELPDTDMLSFSVPKATKKYI